MPSLQDYLNSLPPDQIVRFSDKVSTEYAPNALVREYAKRGIEPVVFLENPNGAGIPLATNLFASTKRIAGIVGVSEIDFQRAPWAASVEEAGLPPTIVDDGPVHEVVIKGASVDLLELPIPLHHEQDTAPYITSGILVVKDPATGIRNMSFARIQVRGRNRVGISIHSRGTAWQSFNAAEAAGHDLHVAVVIGAHPAVYLAASAKVSPDVDEFDIAGALLKEPVALVKCLSSDLEVPAEAEIVLEGRILAGVREDEGPFGEYTGYASSNSTRNVLQVDVLTRRARPVYLDISAGTTEHRRLGSSFKKSHVLSRLREVVPTVRDLNYPLSGVYYNAFLSMHKTAEGQGRHALMLLFGLDSYVKNAVVVDDDIDVFDESAVLWAIATRFQADKDAFIVPNVLCNRLDPSSADGTSAKMGLDATKPLDWRGQRLSVPTELEQWASEFIDRNS